MKLDNLKTIEEMASFLKGAQKIVFAVASSKDERYALVERILKRFSYPTLKRRDKGIVIKFLMKLSGYSRQQITRMIQSYGKEGRLRRYQKTLNGFESIYTNDDIRLLAELDKRHDSPNGFMVKKLCERAYNEFNESAYMRLSSSEASSHIAQYINGLAHRQLFFVEL